MDKLTLDTNIIVLASKDDLMVIDSLLFLRAHDYPTLHISTITRLELFSHSLAQPNELSFITTMINAMVMHFVEKEVTDRAAFLRRTYGIKTMDAIIAATAILYSNGWLWSYDQVFSRIPELKLFESKK